jgi:hypothetical protein
MAACACILLRRTIGGFDESRELRFAGGQGRNFQNPRVKKRLRGGKRNRP